MRRDPQTLLARASRPWLLEAWAVRYVELRLALQSCGEIPHMIEGTP